MFLRGHAELRPHQRPHAGLGEPALAALTRGPGLVMRDPAVAGAQAVTVDILGAGDIIAMAKCSHGIFVDWRYLICE